MRKRTDARMGRQGRLSFAFPHFGREGAKGILQSSRKPEGTKVSKAKQRQQDLPSRLSGRIRDREAWRCLVHVCARRWDRILHKTAFQNFPVRVLHGNFFLVTPFALVPPKRGQGGREKGPAGSDQSAMERKAEDGETWRGDWGWLLAGVWRNFAAKRPLASQQRDERGLRGAQLLCKGREEGWLVCMENPLEVHDSPFHFLSSWSPECLSSPRCQGALPLQDKRRGSLGRGEDFSGCFVWQTKKKEKMESTENVVRLRGSRREHWRVESLGDLETAEEDWQSAVILRSSLLLLLLPFLFVQVDDLLCPPCQ
uniref:Uncharacterized protein n=1 Tax=Chromera velia CCMP2878 TaxID=1169474 RepID=A0A0G4FP45_9ALVE|eukprot:Cvel_3584.t1-p1 / transcript=Cvel_3584.t1 / gene=Cvel_3584 / organism=Chromera_velia_CCMP2878 / gene_product=hypothetical protein / transcript_product=hypothetical protein / location=Cvel_scaffold146:116369-117301(-) / protein_length=311 / sequence_SO=supercontig / SO=protein_coding / is_pseudo=false